jgi:hypothetical protein
MPVSFFFSVVAAAGAIINTIDNLEQGANPTTLVL